MRLAFATQTYNPHINGQGAFARHLAEGLAAAGHRVLVLTPARRLRTRRTPVAGVEVVAVRALPLPFPNVYVTVLSSPVARRVLQAFRPDVVHVHDHYPLCARVSALAVRLALPLVGTNNFLPMNTIAEVTLFRLFPKLVGRILWATVFHVHGRADVVTTPTETAAAILRREGLRVPVEAISCGVDLSRFAPALREARSPGGIMRRAELFARYGLDPARITFLYVGRIAQEKRLDVLVNATRRLDRRDVQLVLAGEGGYRQALEHEAADLIADGRVVFTGFVPDEDLPYLLTSIDVFAMPSEAELQSIATLEAMAAGRPVLAADAQALPELVHDGVNGRLFASGDDRDAAGAMLDLAGRADRGGYVDPPGEPSLVAMGAASLAIVQQHDLSLTVERYADLYRSLI